jgi:hypothetical protein
MTGLASCIDHELQVCVKVQLLSELFLIVYNGVSRATFKHSVCRWIAGDLQQIAANCPKPDYIEITAISSAIAIIPASTRTPAIKILHGLKSLRVRTYVLLFMSPPQLKTVSLPDFSALADRPHTVNLGELSHSCCVFCHSRKTIFIFLVCLAHFSMIYDHAPRLRGKL